MSSEQDEQQIHALFEAGDRALMENDIEGLSRIFAEDYIQYNDSGQPSTREAVFNNLRRGTVRYPSIVSTGRSVRMFGNVAVVHGSELDEVESEGRHSSVRYLYLDVLLRRDGEWRIVASQLARLNEEVLPS
jgi:uncharacterized protein (TIGR02246 family)